MRSREACKSRRGIRVWVALLLCVLLLSGCAPTREQPPVDTPASSAPADTTPSLHLDGRRYTFYGKADGIRVENADFIFQKSGTYRIYGTLTEGSLIVDADETAVVHLILDGLTVTSSDKAPISVLRAAAVTVETADGSVNLLSDTADGHLSDDPCRASVLFADGNLRLCGKGSLVVSGKRQYGVFCTGKTVMESGSLTVSAPEDAVHAGEQWGMTGGRLSVTEAGNGVTVADRRAHAAALGGGTLSMTGGTLVVHCRETALVATHTIVLSGGTGSLHCKEAFVCRRDENGQEVAGTVTVTQNWQKTE